MNPDQPSREHIEARLTALLLGELPADEAELLRYTIAHDPALKKLHDELAATIVLVREAVNAPADAPAEKAEPLKLSGDRREKLLAHFQTAPKGEPLFWLKRINVPSTSTMVIGACLLLLFGGLVAISIPNFVKSRASSQASSVMNNLRQIDAAKNQWALENNKSPAAVPTPADLSPYLVNGGVKPVAGESYVIGKVSGPVIAKADTKKAREQLGSDVVMLPSSGEPQIAMAEKIVPPALAPATPAPVEVASASAPAATPPLSSPRIALPAAEPLSINYATTSDTAGAPAAVDKDQIAGVANSMPLGVARGGGEVYVIKSGDTLSKIAQEHGTTVKALEEANNLTSTKILAGKKMKLPEPPDSDFRGTTFAVNEPVTTSASILTDAGGGGGGFGGGNVSPGSTFQMRMQNANPQQASQVLEKTFSSENAPQSAAARPPGQSPTLAQAELPKDAAVDSFGSNGVDLKSDQAVSGLSDTR
jgi:LysM repeat protein